MDTQVNELLYKEDELHRVFRSENRITEAGDWSDFSIYEWLPGEVVPKVKAEIKNSVITVEAIEGYVPSGYSILPSNISAVGDLNGDGDDDFIVCLYPTNDGFDFME